MKIKVMIDGQNYDVEVEDIDARPVIALVDGERFEVWPEVDDAVEPQTASAPSLMVPGAVQPAVSQGGAKMNADDKTVSAPLPGVIVAILVKPGEGVTRGQELCTLEAMKMKNAIRSTHDGIIASVEVSEGDQVGHGQTLLTYQ